MRAPRLLFVALLLVAAGCGSRTALRRPDADATDATDATDARDATERDVTFVDARRIEAGPTDVVSTDAPPPDDADLAPIAAQLDGLRWEQPCGAVVERVVCRCEAARTSRATLRAPPGTSYRVTWRLRGIAETRLYRGGTPAAPHVVSQGETPPRDDPWNVYELSVGAPAQRYFVNAGVSGRYLVERVDEVFSLQIDAGAELALVSDCVDALQVGNYDALVVPGVAPAPAPFDGQFLQLDVLALERTR